MSNRHTQNANGMTLIELSIVIAIAGILMAMGTGALLRARMVANEAAAIANLQTINNGQFAYLAGCGRGYYAASLDVLGTAVAGKGEGYISGDLASAPVVVKSGYRFEIGPGAGGAAGPVDCNNVVTTQTKYYASATPQSPGSSSSGSRSFATNPNGAIWALPGGTPPDEPFGPPATAAR